MKVHIFIILTTGCMTPEEKFYAKKVAEYEYNIIKNHLKENRISSNNRLFSQSKNGKNFPKQSTMYSPWKIDQKLELIKVNQSQFSGKPKFINNTKNRIQLSKELLTWVGCSPSSLSFAFLYVLLNTLRSNHNKRATEERNLLLKNLLYCVAEQYFNESEKEKLVQGLCLLRSFEGSLSQFFKKRESFESCCLNILSILNSGRKQLQSFDIQSFISKLNNFRETDATQVFLSKTEILKADILYQGEYERDFVIKIILYEEIVSYIISEKGCVFVYESPQPFKQPTLNPDKKKALLRQTIQPSQRNQSPKNLLSAKGIFRGDRSPKFLPEQSNFHDSSLEKNTIGTKNSSTLVQNIIPIQNKPIAQKKLQHPIIFKAHTLNGLWKHKSHEDLQSVNSSVVDNHLLSGEAELPNNNNNFQNILDPEGIKNQQFLLSAHDINNQEMRNFRPESPKMRNIPSFLKPCNKILREESSRKLCKIASMKHMESLRNIKVHSSNKQGKSFDRNISSKLKSPDKTTRLKC